MAAKDIYLINYTPDVGTAQYALSTAIRAGYSDCIPNNLYTQPNGRCVCSVGSLFKPRHLLAKFADTPNPGGQDRNCAVIKFIVPSLADVSAFVTRLKACGAVCVDYVGETWNTVPPSIGGYTPSQALFTVSTGVRSRKVSGVNNEYNSDVLGANQPVVVTYEAEPFSLTGASISDGIVQPGADFENCHGELSTSASCVATQLSPRKVIVSFQYTAANSPTGLTNQTPKRGQRGVAIESRADLGGCIASLGNISGVNCVGYVGETIKRVDILI